MERTRILINKLVFLGSSILEIIKIVICEFWYDYVKLKYGEKEKLCYMDTDGFIVYIKTEDIYTEISRKTLKQDLNLKFQNSNYELDRPLPKEKNEKNNWINER